MATQGLISILNSDGSVKQKVVIGCDGYRVNDAAQRVLQENAQSLEEVYEAAAQEVGCQQCLIVMDAEREIYRGEDDEDRPLYRKTFNDPNFNPRWENGTVYHKVVIQDGQCKFPTVEE